MATTTLGVKLDDASRERLKRAAQSIDRTPHWLIKQAIFTYLEQVERGHMPHEAGATALAEAMGAQFDRIQREATQTL